MRRSTDERRPKRDRVRRHRVIRQRALDVGVWHRVPGASGAITLKCAAKSDIWGAQVAFVVSPP